MAGADLEPAVVLGGEFDPAGHRNLAVRAVFGTTSGDMGADHESDAALMLRVQRGDLVAFEALVDRHKQGVTNLIYRTLPDATEAEDLAQTAFVQVYKSASRYRATAKFTTWLYTIARNLCLNEIRRRSRHPAEALDAPVSGPEGESERQIGDARSFSPDQTALHNELERKVEEALGDLPESQRTALLLCRQEELAYEDIAKVLGCSLSATKSLIHRGRETLRQRLKAYLRSGHWGEAPD
jgi:RNA polymerase sigma-70 factor (ECF subfamily)